MTIKSDRDISNRSPYQSSYKIKDFSIDAESEIRRLEAQVELFWGKELAFYTMFGLKDGMTIVECGCGPGLVGQKLLETFPNSHVTAFEIDPLLVETAKSNAQMWKLEERYNVTEQSIMNTSFEDNTYDFAITRLVLEHLSDPLEAAKEVYRILKPGGKAVFIDNDFEFHMRTHPDIPELRDLYSAYCAAREDEGGNPKIGRELPGILKLAGFSNIDLHIVNAHNGVIGDEIFLKSEGSGIPAQLVKDGYLSGEVYSNIALKWTKLLKAEGHSIFRQLFAGVGEKRTDGNISGDEHKESDIHSEVRNELTDHQTEEQIDRRRPSDEKERYDEPRTVTEKKVAEVWQTILEREQIGINENFFEAGGSSIHAPEIVELLEEKFNAQLSVVDLFDYPTIALLAKYFEPQEQKKQDLTSSERQKIRYQKMLHRRESIGKLRR
jgi:ubiquinone/menaquinone biosynthesis C-methylase UbiE/acyl carrier protein